jgi:sulfide:quinone oxidoreductase
MAVAGTGREAVMKNIVILGAGTGGVIVANLLRGKLPVAEWAISVIDKGSEHVYQPGLLFLPFKLYGYEDPSRLTRPIEQPLPKGVDFVQAEVEHIDTAAREVRTSTGNYPYDFLVTALGCRIAPDEIDGLAEAMGNDVFSFYSLDGAPEFQQTLERFEQGRLVINIAEMPIKCPVAPIEFAFLADYYFSKRGIRDKVEIVLSTPYSGAFTKPVANSVLSKVAEEKGIRIVPNFDIESVDGKNKVIRSFEGEELAYDLLCSIPPNIGPAVLDESGIGDGSGYVITDPRTLKARRAELIYALGDNSNVSTSKAGSVAHFEAETVVENILREIGGGKPLPSFDGHANCFIETGYHKAMLLDFNYDVEPLTGSFPLPGVGPLSLLEESYLNHIGKIAFEWVYWHMLLPGHLSKVPLLPAHMSFLGKNAADAPSIRHAAGTILRDVMTTEVISIPQGTPLSEAAKLMDQHHVSGLPVVDVDGALVGILTEGDFLAALNTRHKPRLKYLLDGLFRRHRAHKHLGTLVDDLMTRRPITIAQGTTLQHAIEMMDRSGIKRLLVTDDDRRLSGVISRSDLPRLFMGAAH